MKRFLSFFVICLAATLSLFFICGKVSGEEIYKVGVGDILLIKVLDNLELSNLSVLVSYDGTITYPYIGSVLVKGMSTAEIGKEITKRLSEGYIKYPVVSVSLLESKSRKIFAYGEFKRLGEIPFADNLTLLNALSLAGGVTDSALYGKLTVNRRKDNKANYVDIAETDLINGLIENKKIRDMVLQIDDILIVEKTKTFLLQGEVQNRGRFPLEKDMTVIRALLQTGGLTKDSLNGTVKVRRKGEEKNAEYKDVAEARLYDGVIDDPVVEDMVLQPDDILMVDRSKTYLVQGEVLNRGRFPLEKDMTVIRALLQAGGVTKEGLNGTIKVRRKVDGKSAEYKDVAEARLYDGVTDNSKVEDMVLQPDDILIVEKNKTFLIQGEVLNRGRLVLEKDMTVIMALLQAGGITKEGLYGKIKLRRKKEGISGEYKDIAEGRINNGVVGSPEVEDMVLEPDDILVVGRNETFYIYGEVNKVGEYVLQDDMTVFKALTIAGGFTKWGSESRVKVLRSSANSEEFEIIKINMKNVIDGDATADIKLQAGDILIASAGIL